MSKMRGWPVTPRDLKCPQCARTYQRVWSDEKEWGTCRDCPGVKVLPFVPRHYHGNSRKVNA